MYTQNQLLFGCDRYARSFVTTNNNSYNIIYSRQDTLAREHHKKDTHTSTTHFLKNHIPSLSSCFIF